MPLHTIPLAEAPSGLPDDADEVEPLGVPEAEPDSDDGEQLPGIPPDGEEPDTAG